jgi:hypothetical protein
MTTNGTFGKSPVCTRSFSTGPGLLSDAPPQMVPYSMRCTVCSSWKSE